MSTDAASEGFVVIEHECSCNADAYAQTFGDLGTGETHEAPLRGIGDALEIIGPR
jgi:hypothetical protein